MGTQLQFGGAVINVSLQAGTQSQISQGSLHLLRQQLTHGQKLGDPFGGLLRGYLVHSVASRENHDADLTYSTQGPIALQLCDLGEFTWHLKAYISLLIKGA